MLKYTLKRIVLIFFTMFIILTLAYILIQLTTSFEERVKFYQMSDPKISYEEAVIYGKKAGWDDPILIKYFNIFVSMYKNGIKMHSIVFLLIFSKKNMQDNK